MTRILARTVRDSLTQNVQGEERLNVEKTRGVREWVCEGGLAHTSSQPWVCWGGVGLAPGVLGQGADGASRGQGPLSP